VRSTVGVTNPTEASPGTIRGDFGLEIGRNLIHASDSTESAEREIGLFFEGQPLVQWSRDTDRWIFE
jgi:nucleoside-diphosphate kinase